MPSAKLKSEAATGERPSPAPSSACPTTPLLLHVGYHKTASSLLQTAIFDRRDFGFVLPAARPRHELVIDFVRPRPFCYAAREMREKYQGFLDEARQNGQTLVLSHERFSGYPPSGGFDSQIIADRLFETFPEGSVLIIIREQVALINSMYSQYITDGGEMTLAQYLSAPQPRLLRMPSFSFEFYEFHRLIGYYQQLFGRDRVLALPYEILRKDPKLFIERITGFCGKTDCPEPALQSVNIRRPMVMQAFQRFGNRFFSENQLSRQAIIPMTRAVRGFGRLSALFDRLAPAGVERSLRRRQQAKIVEAVGDRYAESNRETGDLIGVDLADYGYVCG